MSISCSARSVVAQAQVSIIVLKPGWNTHIVKNSDLGSQYVRSDEAARQRPRDQMFGQTRLAGYGESYERLEQERWISSCTIELM
jgi:hypothetical protein